MLETAPLPTFYCLLFLNGVFRISTSKFECFFFNTSVYIGIKIGFINAEYNGCFNERVQ